MARMSDYGECPSCDLGNSSQLINWILDSGARCNMAPQILDIITNLLEDTDNIQNLWRQ